MKTLITFLTLLLITFTLSAQVKIFPAGGSNCLSDFNTNADISSIGNEWLILDEGFVFDDTSTGYFDSLACEEEQAFFNDWRTYPPPPPSESWKQKFNYQE